MRPTEGSFITRGQAKTMTDDYKNSIAYTANVNQEAIFFGKDKILDVLNQPNVVGLRVYYGRNGSTPTDTPSLVLVGTDVSGNDIYSLILDTGVPCPDTCSTTTF